MSTKSPQPPAAHNSSQVPEPYGHVHLRHEKQTKITRGLSKYRGSSTTLTIALCTHRSQLDRTHGINSAPAITSSSSPPPHKISQASSRPRGSHFAAHEKQARITEIRAPPQNKSDQVVHVRRTRALAEQMSHPPPGIHLFVERNTAAPKLAVYKTSQEMSRP